MNRLKSFTAPQPVRGRKIDIYSGAPRKPLSWLRFTWDLTNLAGEPAPLPAHYLIDRATAEDEAGLRKIFSSAFMLDPVWSPAIGEVMSIVQSALDGAFACEDRIVLALRHGTRIIGAAILHLDAKIDNGAGGSRATWTGEPERVEAPGGDSINQLSPGPAIAIEYRNRGFGTHLLEHSLHALRDVGLTSASGITRDISTAAKFLYPKFGGFAQSAELDAFVVA